MREITREDLEACWPNQYLVDYLADILSGTYDLTQARDDIYGLIGSKYDIRTVDNNDDMLIGGLGMNLVTGKYDDLTSNDVNN